MERKKKTAEQARRDHIDRVLQYQAKNFSEARDIASDFCYDKIDWKRRNRCKKSLKTFCKTYFPAAFKLNWSKDQGIFIDIVEKTMLSGGKCAVGMPRGSGKSTVSRAAVTYGLCYGFIHYATLIAASQPLALRALNFIKTNLLHNDLLNQDFPEVCHAVRRLENRSNRAKGQTYLGRPTEIQWSIDNVRLPIMIFPENIAQEYLKHDKKSIIKVKTVNGPIYMTAQSWSIVTVAGITGNIRGSNDTHPITLEVIRPDYVIIDDVQDDKGAKNPTIVEEMIRTINGAIEGLAGPSETISGVMPCTVIAANDVADQFLSREKTPEWNGVKCKMILSYPEGIDDNSISPDTDSGRLWLEYIDLRKKSFQTYQDNRLAIEFYKSHLEEMRKGFEVSWEDRYDRKNEVDAIQSAMEKRIKSPSTFMSEYQQIGLDLTLNQKGVVSAAEMQKKTIPNAVHGKVPEFVDDLVAFIDIQEECTFWCVLGYNRDFTCFVADYGTYPEIQYNNYNKKQIAKWQLLTHDFFKYHQMSQANILVDDEGRIKADPQKKYRWAIERTVELLRSKHYERLDIFGTDMTIGAIAIDATRGQNTNIVRDYCSQNSTLRNPIFPHFGQFISPNGVQMAEQQRKPTYRFESDWNPESSSCKWILKQISANGFEFHTETAMTKDFLMDRISTPMGSPGCLYLYGGPPFCHDLFCNHVCESEYPEVVIGKVIKNQWKQRNSEMDNDFLDCLVGCCTLASYGHATVAFSQMAPQQTKTLAELAKESLGETTQSENLYNFS